MYDFKNPILNKILIALACFIAFVVTTLILPGVVGTILLVSFLWVIFGLAGWSMGRMNGKIESTEGVNIFKDVIFYEHLVRGPITCFKYF
jgi:hypothetical protein